MVGIDERQESRIQKTIQKKIHIRVLSVQEAPGELSELRTSALERGHRSELARVVFYIPFNSCGGPSKCAWALWNDRTAYLGACPGHTTWNEWEEAAATRMGTHGALRAPSAPRRKQTSHQTRDLLQNLYSFVTLNIHFVFLLVLQL